ncbi:MAG: radical SAM protein [Deltaproteobacteria bacterium]|nr:radical SAM protein [Deltaproteobacteria bacterium]
MFISGLPVRKNSPEILLINPWIHDFAAYDFWAKPVGLLSLASILRQHGLNVSYMDCLDRFHPNMPKTDPHARNGRGPYLKTRAPRPEGLQDIDRKFSRYGIKKRWFMEDLRAIPRPDLVLVTSLMTYWYPGVQETIKIIKKIFPDTPLILGGIYATLFYSHALQHSEADIVIKGQGIKEILELTEKLTGFTPVNKKGYPEFSADSLDTYPYPAFDLQHLINYIPLITSKGCPFACSYCASNFLNPGFKQRSPESVIQEIEYWHKKYKVKDFVFYDDALLVNSANHAVPILEGILKKGYNICFHTPNAIHIREITETNAALMFKAGFKTLRLGLETTLFEDRSSMDRKVTEYDFKKAVTCLKSAGFKKNHAGAYLLAGLPGQTIDSVKDSIRTVKQTGITPIIAYYTPIPHTKMWPMALASSRYNLESDPIFTNNAILPCRLDPFSWETISSFKKLIM